MSLFSKQQGDDQTAQCQRCYKRYGKKKMHLSWAGYHYCQQCWREVSAQEKLFKR